MVDVKDLIKTITSKLSSLPDLPGQGMFGSEQFDAFDFTISMYMPDIEKKNTVNVVGEYVDCIETQYTMMLEKINRVCGKFNVCGKSKVYDEIKNAKIVVVSTSVEDIMRAAPDFKPTRKKQLGNRIYYIGKVRETKIYVNKYVKPGEIYVIDRSIIDVKYKVSMDDDKTKIVINVKTKTNNKTISKYLLTI